MIRVFFDANVIFAAADSKTGAARVLIRLAKQGKGLSAIATPYTIDEAERNIQRVRPEALDEFHKVNEYLSVGLEPSEGFLAGLNSYLPAGVRLPNKDLPVLGGAIIAGADWLVTHDEEHFGPLYGRTIQGVEVMRPGTALWKHLRHARRRR